MRTRLAAAAALHQQQPCCSRFLLRRCSHAPSFRTDPLVYRIFDTLTHRPPLLPPSCATNSAEETSAIKLVLPSHLVNRVNVVSSRMIRRRWRLCCRERETETERQGEDATKWNNYRNERLGALLKKVSPPKQVTALRILFGSDIILFQKSMKRKVDGTKKKIVQV